MRSKFLAALFGALTGASFLAFGQSTINFTGTFSGGTVNTTTPTISTQLEGISPTAPTVGGGFTTHVFNTVGTFTFTPPVGVTTMDVVVVGGGGAGGGNSQGAGGGGGGEVDYQTSVAVENRIYEVSVGTGGTAVSGASGGNGASSRFRAINGSTDIQAIGGGGGARGNSTTATTAGHVGADGGSGGGAGGDDTTTGNATRLGGSSTTGQGGGASGVGSATSGSRRGGGGGGAALAPTGNATGINGGTGRNLSANFAAWGAAGFFGGGGGGGAASATAGTASAGGGAGSNTGNGSAATAATGGGGGGAGGTGTGATGGNGGSGIVLVRYATPTAPAVTHIVHEVTVASGVTFTPPPFLSTADLLIVGGGASGGTTSSATRSAGGGGGAGELVYRLGETVSGTPLVTVGVGGTARGGATSLAGENGGSSSFGSINAGGGGGGGGAASLHTGASGGSGGGSRTGSGAAAGAVDTFGYANAGGAYTGTAGNDDGATGGGGAAFAAAGVSSTGDSLGGAGGDGVQINMTGTAATFAAGGGGGDSFNNTTTAAAGGSSNTGGRGSYDDIVAGAAGAGVANTGSGGGGGNTVQASGAGAAGVIYIRYRPATMSITTQPSTSVVLGSAFATPVQVRLLTAAGAAIVGQTVTAAIETGGGTLGGDTTIETDASGYAIFTDLTINGTAGTRTLSFTVAGSSQKVVSNNVSAEDYDFKIEHDNSGTTCAAETVTIRVLTTLTDTPVTNFTGTITLSLVTGSAGIWGKGSALGTLVDGGLNDGTATYTFVTGDAGVANLAFMNTAASNVNFNAQQGSVEDDNTETDMTVTSCAATSGGQLFASSCSSTSNSVSLSLPPDTDDRIVLVTVHRIGDIGTPPDGTVTFNGTTIANPAGFIEQAEINGVGATDLQTQIWGLLDSQLPAGTGPFTVTASTGAYVTRICALVYRNMQQVTLPLTASTATVQATANAGGTSVTTPTLTAPASANSLLVSAVTADATDGTLVWTVPPDSDLTLGRIFNATENANGFPSLSTSHGIIPNASATLTVVESHNSPNSSRRGVAAVALPTVQEQLHFRISHVGSNASTCQPNAVTISVYNQYGELKTWAGNTLTLGTNSGLGGWSKAGSQTGFTETGTADDGAATYTFQTGESSVTLYYLDNVANSAVNFNLTGTGGVTESQFYDNTMNMSDCVYRVTHPNGSTMDVCSPELVRITVVNGAGVTQTDYTGQVTISTSSGTGRWAIDTGTNAIVDTGTANDGGATYLFDTLDNGIVTLQFRHNADTVTDPDVTLTLTSSVNGFGIQSGYNPPMDVLTCTFRVTWSNPNAMTCEAVTATLGVYSGETGTLASNYDGTVTLNTSNAKGHWVSETGSGALTPSSPDISTVGTGNATYKFETGDAGDVVLTYTSKTLGSFTADPTDEGGDISILPAYDESLNITSCLPRVSQAVCYPNQSQANAITLPSRESTNSSRMVLMYINSKSETAATAATINGASMTRLHTEIAAGAPGVVLQVYGIADSALPANAGTYAADFTGSTNSPAMCLVSVWGVNQTLPLPAVMDDPQNTDPINANNAADTNPISASITTQANNSLVISVAANNENATHGLANDVDAYTSVFTTSSSSTGTSLWSSDIASSGDAFESDWAAHYKNIPDGATLVTATETAYVRPTQQANILLAVRPFVAAESAVSTAYQPVTLFETYSGNVNYRAVGNTLRLSNSPGFECNTTASSTATVTLPRNATVREAYLYWTGSGSYANRDLSVTFGVNGSMQPVTVTDALDGQGRDHTFFIEGNQVYNLAYAPVPESFFAAWAEVTGTMVSNTSGSVPLDTIYQFGGLTVTETGDWATNTTCVSGWALIVVYDSPHEYFNVVNLFHGFQPFWHSNFTLVPRNFRLATPTTPATTVPHGQVTHITFEGDSEYSGTAEQLELQNIPTSQLFTALINGSVNPTDNQYNNTIQYPLYDNVGAPDFTGYNSPAKTDAYGVDVDTYFIEGDSSGDHLYPFGVAQSEQITTRYSTDNDIVLLVGEAISVTNGPIADLEVMLSSVNDFWTGHDSTGLSGDPRYEFTVQNNSNGSDSTVGYADGDVILTGNLQSGITIDTISGTGWSCPLQTDTAFTCIYDITASAPGGQLAESASLPVLSVTVDIASEVTFPLSTQQVAATARIAHVGAYSTCTAEAAGVQPNPNPATGCSVPPQFDNVNDLNKYLIDIDTLSDGSPTNNNVDRLLTNVIWRPTDLLIDKILVGGSLSVGVPAHYTIQVTNDGPAATTKTITVVDQLPVGLDPDTGTTGGTGWSCGFSGLDNRTVTCTHAGLLADNASTAVLDIYTQPLGAALEGLGKTNTATATIAAGNNDTTSPTTDFVTTTVAGPVVDTQGKYLISVSTDGTTYGSYTFNKGDLVLFDANTALVTPFLLESDIEDDVAGEDTDLGDVDALHVLPNGRIVISTRTDGSTIKGLAFNAEDLVMYDPITGTVTLVFDGSAIFRDPTGTSFVDNEDIDGLHVLFNNSYTPSDWDLLISTSDAARIGGTSFNDNDIVLYDMSAATASVQVNGNTELFNSGEGNITGLYLRYDDADNYMLTSSDADGSAIVGTSFAIPRTYDRDDIVEVDLTGQTATILDRGDLAPGIYSPVDANRSVDAIHAVEAGYFGHFQLSSNVIGNTCTPLQITIRKHVGTGHASVDLNYEGWIKISNSDNAGSWSADIDANGQLITDADDVSDTYHLNPGEAIYHFDSLDDGEVVLYLEGTLPNDTLDINVTNGFVTENTSGEDAIIDVDQLTPTANYRDEFTTQAYNRNDGNVGFSTSWTESNDDGNPAAGYVRISGGKLRFTNYTGGSNPTLTRQIDFDAFSDETAPTLSFKWSIEGTPTGQFVVEARDSDSDPTWVELYSNSLNSGTNVTESGIPFTGVTRTATTQIRMRLVSGYGVASDQAFVVDDLEVSTTTTSCFGADTIDHYRILPVSPTMVSCQVKDITIQPHTASHLPGQPGQNVTITLNTTTGRGTWGPPSDGLGAFTSVPGTGYATYQYQGGEDYITFPFYYTDMSDGMGGFVDSQLVGFTVSDSQSSPVTQNTAESGSLTVSRAGFRFWNETAGTEVFPTLVAGMPSNQRAVLTVQAIRVDPLDPAACVDIFPVDTSVPVQLSVECNNPDTCSAGPVNVQVTSGTTATPVITPVAPVNSNATDGVLGGWTTVPLYFTNDNLGVGAQTFSRAELVLDYADVGQMQLHARYELEELNQSNAVIGSGDYLQATSNNFIMRPFGFNIDFNQNRQNTYGVETPSSWTGVDSYAADATDPEDFMAAGVDFPVTISAVVWQAVDDDSTAPFVYDGIPEAGAFLHDNATAPNYGNEDDGAGSEDDVTISYLHKLPTGAGTDTGSLSGTLSYSDFGDTGVGAHTADMSYSEVGIIDITATLTDTEGDGYLGGGLTETVTGTAYNVGRFRPAYFDSVITFTPRPRLNPDDDDFTYMGEEFGVSFVLTAKNNAGTVTKNYEGAFAKFRTTTNPVSFYAIDDRSGQADLDLTNFGSSTTVCNGTSSTQRLCQSATNPFDFTIDWSDGVRSGLAGRMIFSRGIDELPDGPYEDLQIAFSVLDSDGAADLLTANVVEVDDDAMDTIDATYNRITPALGHKFRYGRLRLENAYGSEIPELDDMNDPTGLDVDVRLRAEYWDGTRFVTNPLDQATPYTSVGGLLSFVAGSYDPANGANEAVITPGSGIIKSGSTLNSTASDIPLYIQAPDEGNEGQVRIELNLDGANQYDLHFLKFNWRSAGELEDIVLDGDTSPVTDNPRSLVEFGTFRGNDRIINWQEIFE